MGATSLVSVSPQSFFATAERQDFPLKPAARRRKARLSGIAREEGHPSNGLPVHSEAPFGWLRRNSTSLRLIELSRILR
jgi:hypothetical protein